jgi:TPR repeat protein
MAISALKPILLAGLLAVAAATPAAADLAGGVAAYDAGDYLIAYRELRGLAELGEPVAQHILARMYFAGQGVPEDARQGVAWERKAAALGEKRAQLDLGLRYQYAIGVTQDVAEAETWYRLAAEQDLPVAQYRLALLLLDAADARPDLVDAHMWLNLAAAKLPAGDVRTGIVAARDAVAEKMTNAQLREAQNRARDWRPKSWLQLTARGATP